MNATARRSTTFAVLAAIAAGALIFSCARGPEPGAKQTASAGENGEKPASALPPLVVDRSAPLLLLDGPPTPTAGGGGILGQAKATSKTADNSTCFVCHDNYRTEPLAVKHAAENFNCMRCHGDSYAHKNDENHTTPPDIMFPPEKIAPLCNHCHQSHNAPAAKVIARWRERCPEKTNPETLVCTDCHGAHRLKRRAVRWNKQTGELLPKK